MFQKMLQGGSGGGGSESIPTISNVIDMTMNGKRIEEGSKSYNTLIEGNVYGILHQYETKVNRYISVTSGGKTLDTKIINNARFVLFKATSSNVVINANNAIYCYYLFELGKL